MRQVIEDCHAAQESRSGKVRIFRALSKINVGHLVEVTRVSVQASFRINNEICLLGWYAEHDLP
jgi:hypothetical protein